MPSLVLWPFSGQSGVSTSGRRVLYLVRSCIPPISLDMGKNAMLVLTQFY